MPITVTRTLYYYEDLDERGKEKAREWYRCTSADDSFWAERVIEDAANITDILGIDLRTRCVTLVNGGHRYEPAVYWSGFWSQGDGACFEGTYKYAKGSTKKIRKEAPEDKTLHKIADRLYEVQRKVFYKLTATVKHSGHYHHEYCTDIMVDLDEEATNSKLTSEEEEEIKNCLRAFMRWIYESLEKAYEFENSDEVVAENIITNEYTFNEEGNRS